VYKTLFIALVTVMVLTAVVPQAQYEVDRNRWMLVEPGIGFQSMECDYNMCWIQFAMPVYANEIWQYSDGHLWIWGLYIPSYTPRPLDLGIGVWNGNATIVLVTHNLIRIIVEAPTGAKSTLILYGVKPYRVKMNGRDITPRAVPSLDALNRSSLAWLHTGLALYLRATHSSPVIWDIELKEPPKALPEETQTPVAVFPYYTETPTTTPTETITITQEEAYNIYTILTIAVIITVVVAGLIYMRKRM